MSAQQKKNNFSLSDQVEEKNVDSQPKLVRPNIDHLLKRISIKRKQERNYNLTMMIISVASVAIVSLLFTQY
jgi:hypothetical protein